MRVVRFVPSLFFAVCTYSGQRDAADAEADRVGVSTTNKTTHEKGQTKRRKQQGKEQRDGR